MRSHLLVLLAAGLCAGEAITALPAPGRIELYLDGARLTHVVQAPAGRSRIPFPAESGRLVQVDGADTWVVETRIDEQKAPELPALLTEIAAARAALDREAALIAGQETTAERLAAELGHRLAQRGLTGGDETAAWQESIDGFLGLRARIAERRLAHDAARQALRQRAESEAAPGLTCAAILGFDGAAAQADQGDPAAFARRAWSAALERSAVARILVLERAKAGPVTVVTEREDLRWSPRARLVVARRTATLVRQAAVQVPAGLALPAVPTRLVGGARAQPLAGAALTPREIAAADAPVAERRSVTTTARASGWTGEGAATAAREQTWELPALALVAPAGQAAEVMAELQKGQLKVAADEWVLAPDLAPVLVRRLSVALDDRPLAEGSFELVVDGTVLGRRPFPATPAGTVLHLSAGEDQRVFLAGSAAWPEDANRPVNRKREGTEHRVRNLSGDNVSFVCYLTRPLSAAKGVTVSADPATTPGWKEAQPGILRWELTLKPGEELPLRNGWVIEAEGSTKL